jgi:MOSC domain-containing protein YiiM
MIATDSPTERNDDMKKGSVLGIFVAPQAGDAMQPVESVVALAGDGLIGDRYRDGKGAWNKGKPGKRQVTLINGLFFEGTNFNYAESRRNIITGGVELMDLIGKEFGIGDAVFRGHKYCDPCERPSKLAGVTYSFRDAFFDRGGLVAEIVQGGVIRINDAIVPPKKDY